MLPIEQLEDRLARAQVIDPTQQSGDRVIFGATVVLVDVESDERITYTIVGEDEADVSQGLISVTSPVARAIMGREEGSSASLTATLTRSPQATSSSTSARSFALRPLSCTTERSAWPSSR